MLCFLLITSIIPIAQARPLEQTSLPSTISVDMFVLNTTTSAKVLPEQRCASSSSTATAYGCTWASDGPYPYTSNPVTLNIEGDYLLDVMPRESNPEEGFLLPALKAQAVAARSYAFYKISINDVIDNSVNDQVFVPYFFDRLGYFPGPGGIDPPTNRIPVNINPCTDGFF
jgi:peptidoglycan hydrolase-like amidase